MPELVVREVADDGQVVIRNAPLTTGGELISEPDVQTYLVSIVCHCGSTVAVLWSNDRKERTGKPAFYFIQTQIIEDIDAQSESTPRIFRGSQVAGAYDKDVHPEPTTRMFETVVGPDSSPFTDCPAHGRQRIDAAALIKRAKKVETKIIHGGKEMEDRMGRGEERAAKYILPRVAESLM